MAPSKKTKDMPMKSSVTRFWLDPEVLAKCFIKLSVPQIHKMKRVNMPAFSAIHKDEDIMKKLWTGAHTQEETENELRGSPTRSLFQQLARLNITNAPAMKLLNPAIFKPQDYRSEKMPPAVFLGDDPKKITTVLILAPANHIQHHTYRDMFITQPPVKEARLVLYTEMGGPFPLALHGIGSEGIRFGRALDKIQRSCDRNHTRLIRPAELHFLEPVALGGMDLGSEDLDGEGVLVEKEESDDGCEEEDEVDDGESDSEADEKDSDDESDVDSDEENKTSSGCVEKGGEAWVLAA